jgi:cytochrome c oxidase subunit 3
MSEAQPKPGQSSILRQRDNPKLAIWFFLGGEVVFFSTLILTLVLARIEYASQYPAFRANLSIPLIAGNTFVLIASSYLVVRALEAIREGNEKGLRRNLLGVLLLGLVFLGGQAFEWTTLFSNGVGVSSPFGTPFFTVTGIHGTHVFIGVLWGAYLLVYASRHKFSARDHRGIENFGLYWHFVDIVWIVLFTLIYLI